MNLERNDRMYADHILIGDNGDNFFSKSYLEKALDQGWSEGCPVAISLTKEPTEGGRGAVIMANRYGEVNFWFGYIVQTLNKTKPWLSYPLTSAIPRLPNEPIGKHDENWIPKKLNGFILNTPYGYSLPRVLINFINCNKEDHLIYAKQNRLIRALDAFDVAISNSKNIIELVVQFTNELVIRGGDEKLLIKNIIPNVKIKEDNCHTTYKEIARVMEHSTPNLWRTYSAMSSQERSELGIANVI